MLDMNKHCLKDHYEILKRDWIPCPDCHLYFRNQQGLTAHTHQKHPKENKTDEVLCQFCSKAFFSKETLNQVNIKAATKKVLNVLKNRTEWS